jgi:hypothetical protein
LAPEGIEPESLRGENSKVPSQHYKPIRIHCRRNKKRIFVEKIKIKLDIV